MTIMTIVLYDISSNDSNNIENNVKKNSYDGTTYVILFAISKDSNNSDSRIIGGSIIDDSIAGIAVATVVLI